MVISLILGRRGGVRIRGREKRIVSEAEFQRVSLHKRFCRSPNILCPKSNVESRHSDVGENTNFTLSETSFERVGLSFWEMRPGRGRGRRNEILRNGQWVRNEGDV